MKVHRVLEEGTCEHCRSQFGYSIIHNDFNNSAFAYCDSCGATAILSECFDGIPENVSFRPHGPISVKTEQWLQPCNRGGSFKSDASPRCPNCKQLLSAEGAALWIERNAAGTALGWRWQNSWSGVYCVVLENRMVADNWRTVAA